MRLAAISPVQTITRPAVDSPRNRLHEVFFKAGIVVVLTLGATWGLILLARIGAEDSFTAIGIHAVNAHGHAQIFGWVGLFVMGFAYGMIPSFKETTLPYPRTVVPALVLMGGGLTIRSLAQGSLAFEPGLHIAGLAGSSAEIIAIALFTASMLACFHRSARPWTAADWYITAALVFFLFQAVAGAAYFEATAQAASREALLSMVATWQAALRDIQIHGFILLMVLGVSQYVLPKAFGLPRGRRRLALACLVVLGIGIGAESGGLVLMQQSGHAWAGLWYGGVIALALATSLLAWNWRVFGQAPESNRSLKFVRAAYAWLLVSMLMLLFLPVHQFGLLRGFAPESRAAEIGFSHAYYGAIRHAITVGFVSLMILGVSSWIVPSFRGLRSTQLPSLWLPFVLVNAGCALRVGMQIATDFDGRAFPLIALSGVMELTGLALWAIHLWRLMNHPAVKPGLTPQPVKELT